jgi:hypothetical protein
MTQTQFPQIVVRNYSELVDALARWKNEVLSISNEQLEHIAGFTRGHADKMLGPTRQKGIGQNSFDLLLGALGVRLRLEIDPEQMERVASRHTPRNEKQLRNRLSRAALDRARPIILSELGRRGAIATNRLKAQRRNGNGHAER